MNGTAGAVAHSYPTHSRVIVDGIPYYVDTANNLFAYGIDSTGPRLQIGTYDSATQRVTLAKNWRELLDARLPAYRASAAGARLRIDPAATKQTRTKRSSGVSKAKASS